MLAGEAEQVCRAQAVDRLLGERLCRLFLAFFQVLHVVDVLGPGGVIPDGPQPRHDLRLASGARREIDARLAQRRYVNTHVIQQVLHGED